MANIQFSERQHFRQWWLWAILLGVNGIAIYFFVAQALGHADVGFRQASLLERLVGCAIPLLLTAFIAAFRLDTTVDATGVTVRFFPFHLKVRHFPWASLTKSYVRQYSPIGEYGGWGLRWGWGSGGSAYNVAGNMGLQLEFSDGKRLLIGTGKADELTQALQQLGHATA